MVPLHHLNVLHLDVRVKVLVLAAVRLILAIRKVILRVCGLLCGILDHKRVSSFSFFNCIIAVLCWQALNALWPKVICHRGSLIKLRIPILLV
jgi:hypothetical protein